MKTSKRGQEFMHQWEGYRDRAYLDTGGVWTIGYGTTRVNGRPVKEGMTGTKDQAAQWFAADLKWAEAAVNDFVQVSISQNQFDALVSFVYNVGVNAFRSSTLLRVMNQNDFIEAGKQFLRWKFDNGRVIQGLLNRRIAERELFETVDTLTFKPAEPMTLTKVREVLKAVTRDEEIVKEMHDRLLEVFDSE